MFEKKTRYDCIQGWVTAISVQRGVARCPEAMVRIVDSGLRGGGGRK